MRKLIEYEVPLVKACFEFAGLEFTDDIIVHPMDDGDMGSLIFNEHKEISSFGVAKCHFIDEDGVFVSVTLNASANGEPAELDIWKVDFSPVKRWPERHEIRLGLTS